MNRSDDTGISAGPAGSQFDQEAPVPAKALDARALAIILPDGEYTISRACNDSIRNATGAVPHRGDEEPHPILATVATLAATGLSIDDLCHLCDASVADGPMLGECRIVRHHALRFDVPYRVQRRVLSIERKHGRRLAAMDLLRFVAVLVEPGAVIAAEVTYTWVLPKGVAR